MCGRGAASGTGKHPYGSEYKTVLQDGNIKLVKCKLAGNAKAPLERQTKERIYVTVNNNNELAFVSYYDDDGKRSKTIDLLHAHGGKLPHSHAGYEHSGKASELTEQERSLLARVRKVWYDSKGK